jgi:hypothetical protein
MAAGTSSQFDSLLAVQGKGTHADGVIGRLSQPITGARSAIGGRPPAFLAGPCRGKGRWLGAPGNVGGRRPGTARRLRGRRPAARTGRTAPSADRVLRSRHLRGTAVHRGDLQRSGWSRASHTRAVIAAGLVTGSGAHRDHSHPGGCVLTQGRGRVRTGAQASPGACTGLWARAFTLACMVAAVRGVVGLWSRPPGRPRPGFRRLAGWPPLGGRIRASPDSCRDSV